MNSHELCSAVNDWTERRFLFRGSYYSGRGAITSDLNSPLLEQIFDGILKDVGQDEADNFYMMVAEMQKLSATGFINAFAHLADAGWDWDSISHHYKKDRPDNDFKTGENEAADMCSLIGAMFGDSSRDETPQIRGQFLHSRKGKLSEAFQSRADAVENEPFAMFDNPWSRAW